MDCNFNELISRCRKGDNSAVEEVLLRMMPLVKKTALSFSSDKNSVEDLIQEGYVTVIESIRTYDPEKGITYPGYLKTALSYGIIRRMNKCREMHFEDMCPEGFDTMELIADDKPTPEELVLMACVRYENFQLEEAMGMLTDRQRRVIEDSFFKGRTLRQIASDMDRGYISVVKLKARAFKNLKKLMSNV